MRKLYIALRVLCCFAFINSIVDKVYALPSHLGGYSPATIVFSQATSPEDLQITRNQEPNPLIPDEVGQVTLRLQAEVRPACEGIPALPVDMMLVFDISTSAGMGSGSNWQQTITFTHQLLEYLDRPIYRSSVGSAETSQVGLITSKTGQLGPEPELLQPLTNDYALLKTRLESLLPGGDTDLADGIRMAMDELRQAPDEHARVIVLLLHDAVALEGSMQDAIAEVQSAGFEVYLIVNSRNIPPEKLITRESVSSIVSLDHALFDPVAEDLRALFFATTKGNVEWVVADVRVSETYSPSGQVALVRVEGPGGRIDNDRVSWKLPGLASGEAAVLSYDLRTSSAEAVLDVQQEATWLDCNGYPVTPAEKAIVVDVQEGGADVPDVTQEPIITPTSEILPEDRSNSGWQLFRRENWWWLLLLLLLLLLLPLLFNLLKKRKSKEEPVKRPGERSEDKQRPSPLGESHKQTPVGIDLFHGWTTQKATDKNGKPITLRLRSDCVEGVQQALNTGGRAILYARVDEMGVEVANAALRLEVVQEPFDPVTGQRQQWVQAVWDTLEVPLNSNRRRHIGTLMAERLEELAKQFGARIITCNLGTSDVLPFFLSRHYQKRQGQQGASVTKKLT